MYFDSFPVIRYGSTDGTIKNVTNLLRRVAIRSKLKTNVSFFDTYDVKNGETPQKIEVYDPELISSDTDAYTSATAITNREFEESEQDKKRKIRLLDPIFVDQFVEEFNSLIKESVL